MTTIYSFLMSLKEKGFSPGHKTFLTESRDFIMQVMKDENVQIDPNRLKERIRTLCRSIKKKYSEQYGRNFQSMCNKFPKWRHQTLAQYMLFEG